MNCGFSNLFDPNVGIDSTCCFKAYSDGNCEIYRYATILKDNSRTVILYDTSQTPNSGLLTFYNLKLDGTHIKQGTVTVNFIPKTCVINKNSGSDEGLTIQSFSDDLILGFTHDAGAPDRQAEIKIIIQPPSSAPYPIMVYNIILSNCLIHGISASDKLVTPQNKLSDCSVNYMKYYNQENFNDLSVYSKKSNKHKRNKHKK